MSIKALPQDKQNQVVDQFLALSPQKKDGDTRDDGATDWYTAQRTAVPIPVRSTSLAS
jgi:hypothetical protein